MLNSINYMPIIELSNLDPRIVSRALCSRDSPLVKHNVTWCLLFAKWAFRILHLRGRGSFLHSLRSLGNFNSLNLRHFSEILTLTGPDHSLLWRATLTSTSEPKIRPRHYRSPQVSRRTSKAIKTDSSKNN